MNREQTRSRARTHYHCQAGNTSLRVRDEFRIFPHYASTPGEKRNAYLSQSLSFARLDLPPSRAHSARRHTARFRDARYRCEVARKERDSGQLETKLRRRSIRVVEQRSALAYVLAFGTSARSLARSRDSPTLARVDSLALAHERRRGSCSEIAYLSLANSNFPLGSCAHSRERPRKSRARRRKDAPPLSLARPTDQSRRQLYGGPIGQPTLVVVARRVRKAERTGRGFLLKIVHTAASALCRGRREGFLSSLLRL